MPYFPIQASTLFIELRFVISVPQCNVWNKRVSLRNTGSHIHFLSVSSTDLVSSWNAIFSLRYSATVSTIGKDSGSISRIMAHKLWRKEHDLRPSPTKIQLFYMQRYTKRDTLCYVQFIHQTSDHCQPLVRHSLKYPHITIEILFKSSRSMSWSVHLTRKPIISVNQYCHICQHIHRQDQ